MCIACCNRWTWHIRRLDSSIDILINYGTVNCNDKCACKLGGNIGTLAGHGIGGNIVIALV